MKGEGGGVSPNRGKRKSEDGWEAAPWGDKKKKKSRPKILKAKG